MTFYLNVLIVDIYVENNIKQQQFNTNTNKRQEQKL